jgi:hypothetical protein
VGSLFEAIPHLLHFHKKAVAMLSLTCGVSSILIRHCLLDCNQDWSNRLFCHEIPIYRLATTSVHPHYCFSSHFHFSFKAFLSIIILGLL